MSVFSIITYLALIGAGAVIVCDLIRLGRN